MWKPQLFKSIMIHTNKWIYLKPLVFSMQDGQKERKTYSNWAERTNWKIIMKQWMFSVWWMCIKAMKHWKQRMTLFWCIWYKKLIIRNSNVEKIYFFPHTCITANSLLWRKISCYYGYWVLFNNMYFCTWRFGKRYSKFKHLCKSLMWTTL